MSHHALPEHGEPMSFYDRFRTELAEVFEITHTPAETLDSLETAVDATQPWIRGDHFRPGYQFDLDEGQERQLGSLFEKVGMTAEVPLPVTDFSEIILLGGIQRGNNRRLDFLRRSVQDHGVTSEETSMLGGQREIYAESEAVDINQNMADIAQRGSYDPWFRSLSAGSTQLKWETDLLRLASLAQLGDVALRRLHLRIGNRDPIQRYELDWQGRKLDLLHVLAVARDYGKPRHNSEACISEWLEFRQPPENATVAFIGSNPHLNRMVTSARYMLRQAGRDDIRLVPGGSATIPDASPMLYMGEIARSLYEDLRLSV